MQGRVIVKTFQDEYKFKLKGTGSVAFHSDAISTETRTVLSA